LQEYGACPESERQTDFAHELSWETVLPRRLLLTLLEQPLAILLRPLRLELRIRLLLSLAIAWLSGVGGSATLFAMSTDSIKTLMAYCNSLDLAVRSPQHRIIVRARRAVLSARAALQASRRLAADCGEKYPSRLPTVGRLSVRGPVRLSVCPSVGLSVCPFVRRSVCASVVAATGRPCVVKAARTCETVEHLRERGTDSHTSLA
jgi:hypothetical protein